ncbi:Uncharacterised protein [uncultured archaeon]|nr:Uncharacterised protein [uncultured archaeon]
MNIKVHTLNNEVLVAACDRSLLDKTLVHGDVEFHVNPAFYGNTLADEKTLIEALKKATIANLVGKKCVAAAVKSGYINQENILIIDGVPHAQMIVVL